MSENSIHPDTLLQYQIVLTLLPGVGPVTAKDLMSYCGGLEGVFKASKKTLMRVPGIGDKTADAICNMESALFLRAEEEVGFIRKKEIKPLFYTDKDYPANLRRCKDAPVLLFYKGSADLQNTKTLSVVGTRNGNDYGQELCNNLAKGLAPHQPLVVSGLAFGIDTFIHRACLQHKLPTVAVLAHGLDAIYPSENREMAMKMTEHGGIISEYLSKTIPDRENFPRRNRIVAGLTEATVVVQTAKKGGSMITAYCAAGYNRGVFAFPGRINDPLAVGCNYLIKTKTAELIESAADIIDSLNWSADQSYNALKVVQQQLFVDLNDDEKKIVAILEKYQQPVHIDDLMIQCAIGRGTMAATLLELELKNILKAMPGSMYKLLSFL